MVFGWRRAFCTSVPPDADSAIEPARDDHEDDTYAKGNGTPKFGNRFGFFTSSTPRLQSQQRDPSPSLRCRTTRATLPAESASVPVSPKLQCKTSNSPRLFNWSSNPSSPRSPSTFSLLKSNLRLSTTRCGLCLQSVKRGRGIAIFTAECSHGFHFPCIAGHVKKKGSLSCPICGTLWKQMPLLSVNDQKHQFAEEEEEEESTREKLATTLIGDVVEKKKSKLRKQHSFRPDLKVYDDDEPLASLTPKARFNPIPESDENCDEDSIGEFQGFHVDGCSNSPVDIHARDVDVRLLPEAAVVSSGRSHETYAIVLRAKAPVIPEKTQGRAPIDLVTVVDVSGKMSSEKLQMMKRAMRLIISSLSSSDRLSIVAFSSYSKRLLPLKRMTTSGQRAARRIVEAMVVLEGSSNSSDAVKKAAKVLEDRRQKNTVASIVLLSNVADQPSCFSSTRYSQSHLDVAVHTLKLAVIDDHTFAKSIGSLLNVVVQDLQLQLGFASGSAPAEITAVYAYSPRPVALGSGTVRIGELIANEERELLIELKVPSSAVGTQKVLSVRCSYRESVSQEVIYCKEHALVVPRPHTVRSSALTIQRLRNLFVTTRALAESRRLTARNDLIGAYHMLISARALVHQASLASTNEFMISLEAELNELQRRRQSEAETQTGRGRVEMAAYMDEKEELLTPTSAWRVAEKLAKVAIMRKSLNRVSDLHGFEDARF
ncbi:probable E3 ubiquitin-protein ligase EDA40 [Cynara cardunculus var. scolymus]|uniref:probable E3 ubiquitin-protein ligase EDA40 n=1 Tax=Cynara cardunculus var. scolymus TaxID=59895 RepID=UPI000D62D85A|nr:probable E3 ubiquitin-protein ligase EDA40 [Cynara cardunculus var. scolymus]